MIPLFVKCHGMNELLLNNHPLYIYYSKGTFSYISYFYLLWSWQKMNNSGSYNHAVSLIRQGKNVSRHNQQKLTHPIFPCFYNSPQKR